MGYIFTNRKKVCWNKKGNDKYWLRNETQLAIIYEKIPKVKENILQFNENYFLL